MARVECATQAWGWIADAFGNGQANRTVVITQPDGTPVSVWTAATGGAAITPVTTRTDGSIPGFIDVGSYRLSVDGATPVTIEAVSGSTTGGLVVESDPVATAALATHEADTTNIHGIADTSALILTDDARLSDARTPTTHTHDDRYYTETEVNTLIANVWVQVTQAQYNALSPPNPNTLYIIVG